MHKALRFGVPLGSAIILVAFWETVDALFTLAVDFGGALSIHVEAGAAAGIGWFELAMLSLVFIQLVSTISLLFYGALVQGSRPAYLLWFIIISILWVIYIIFMLLLVGVSAYHSEPLVTFKFGYILVYCVCIATYELHLVFKCHKFFKASELHELDPVGRGFRFLVDHYKSHPHEACLVVIMSEIIIMQKIFFQRQLLRFGLGHEFLGHEADSSAAILAEEIVIRYIRFAICVVGFYLAYKEKQYWMTHWCYAYAGTLFSSVIILFYLIVDWKGDTLVLSMIRGSHLNGIKETMQVRIFEQGRYLQVAVERSRGNQHSPTDC